MNLEKKVKFLVQEHVLDPAAPLNSIFRVKLLLKAEITLIG